MSKPTETEILYAILLKLSKDETEVKGLLSKAKEVLKYQAPKIPKGVMPSGINS